MVGLPDDSSAVTGTLSCTMKYRIKDCDPVTGQSDDDEEGYPDEFVVWFFIDDPLSILFYFLCIAWKYWSNN